MELAKAKSEFIRKEIKKILTPEQMEKWSAKREAKMERTKKNGG